MTSPTQTAVFDLDGTLLAGDSTTAWLHQRLRRSPMRLLGALLLAPLALPLLRWPSTRRTGASMFLWVASAGLSESDLQRSFAAFVDRIERGESAVRWYADALDALQQHLSDGHRVVVVTAAPEWLAERLLVRWTGRLHVIGSRLRRRGGGWVCASHCRGVQKCQRLQEQGFGQRWDYAYSDSDDDLPILLAASSAHIINAAPAVQARLLAGGLIRFEARSWR